MTRRRALPDAKIRWRIEQLFVGHDTSGSA
jgi:hypothetical protein